MNEEQKPSLFQKLEKYKLFSRPRTTLLKKTKILAKDNFTIYEGEVDQLDLPSGCGCLIRFTQPIKGIPLKGKSNKICVYDKVKL